jgi:hypothetical protein
VEVFVYTFVSLFFYCISAMEEEKTYTGQHVNTGAPLTVEKDDKCKLQPLI